MFHSLRGGLRLHGKSGEILWGYHPAAVLRTWRIRNHGTHWTLTAQIARVDAFQLRQTPLLFSAPRDKGFWCWGVESCALTGPDQLTARLGPPEA